MKVKQKKFIALLLVFVSVLTFIPISFLNNVQVANAEDVIPSKPISSGQDIDKINFGMRGAAKANDFGTEMHPSSQLVNGSQVFIQESGGTSNYKFVLNDISMTDQQVQDKLRKDADNEYIKYQDGLSEEKKLTDKGVRYYMTAIVSQEIKITSINQIDVSTPSKASEVEQRLGIKIIDDNYNADTKERTPLNKGNNQKYWVKTIAGVPYGINQITYDIKVKETTYEYNPYTGIMNEASKEKVGSVKDQEKVYIYNGTNFANNQVKSLIFDQYVGSPETFNDPAMKKNNTIPFLYKSEAKPRKDIPLKYEWKVPDSTRALRYNFIFNDSIDEQNGVNVYVGGNYSGDASHSGSTISGYLTELSSTSNFIVIKFGSQKVDDGTGTNLDTMTKCYSIELSYSTKDASADHTIRKGGITKLDGDANSSIDAYIGKEFTHYIRENDEVDIYNGEITIDSRASMISIDPELVCGKSKVAYSIQNNYIKGGKPGVRDSIMKNGKQYVEFNYGESNTIQLNVYSGDGEGNIDFNADGGKSKLLAIYYLKVNTSENSEKFTTMLSFDDDQDDDTFLTQEGVEIDEANPKENEMPFSPKRTNYTLYTKNDDALKISLTNRSSSNEYIRVYYSDSTSGNLFTEFSKSADNPLVGKVRNTDIFVEPSSHKRIKVQAYYDKFDDATGELIESYPLGEEYIFYLGKNITQDNRDNTNGKSDNADLSNIKVKGETLYDLDDRKGFSKDNLDYKVKVDKNTKTAKFIVTSEDENVKSMVATVNETGVEYDLYSGEETEITLNDSGVTNVTIFVTAQNGKSTKSYTVAVVNNTKGGSALLKNLILSTGDFNFNSSESDFKVSVDQATNNISITPVTEDPKAKVTVDEQKYSGNAINVSLSGTQKKKVEIVVVSEDGKNKKVYILNVKRVTSGSELDDDDLGIEDDSYFNYDNDIWIDNSKYDEWGKTSDGRIVYYDKKGRQVKDIWIQTNGKYYYINKAGYRSTGWKIDSDGKTYYLDPRTGEMRTGWINVDGSTYYLNPRGIMQKGWLNIGDKWYYFTYNGKMVANTSMYIDERLYKFTQDGIMYY
ncbi:MAG: hypothetical protein E7207_08250 [Clostridium butyricum]|nr:hypothetical protein [Clostridium butyricum]